jgi:hypothetical protein
MSGLVRNQIFLRGQAYIAWGFEKVWPSPEYTTAILPFCTKALLHDVNNKAGKLR